jgi:hypothetical protein
MNMGFLDSLESNLKALESQGEGVDAAAQKRRREEERKQALAAAPWAERLRSGPYTERLLSAAVRAGHARRTKVHMAWLDTVLRLEAGGRRLELRPRPDGVVAVCLEENREVRSIPVDLQGDPETLVLKWLG